MHKNQIPPPEWQPASSEPVLTLVDQTTLSATAAALPPGFLCGAQQRLPPPSSSSHAYSPAPLGTRRHASEIALAKETRPQSRSRTEELVIAYNELNKENTNRKVVEEALPGSGSGFRTTQVTTDAEQRQEIGVGRIARTLCFAFHNLANT